MSNFEEWFKNQPAIDTYKSRCSSLDAWNHQQKKIDELEAKLSKLIKKLKDISSDCSCVVCGAGQEANDTLAAYKAIKEINKEAK